MKITIEMNTKDLASAKAEHLNRVIAAAQAVAIDTTEAEQAGEPVAAAPVAKTKPKQTEEPVEAEPVKAEPRKAAVTKKQETKAEQKPAVEMPKTPSESAPKAEAKEKDEQEAPAEEPAKKAEPTKDKQEAPAEEPAKDEPKITHEVVLAKFKELAKAKKARELKAILQKHGIAKVSAIPDNLLGTILQEAEAIE